MKRSNVISLVVLFAGGALTAFLWLPLLPIIVPLVTLTLGLKWASTNLLSEARFGEKASSSKLLYFPATQQHTSPSQVHQPTTWPSSASLSSPARTGSLPFLSKERKNFKKQLRERRHMARALSGLELRRSSPAHG